MNRLIYLPLGGAGEIGMNMYVYGFGPPGQERLIVVDSGLTFPDMDSTPGVEWIMPEVGWLVQNRDRIEAIFLTHAHEDHIGAAAILHERTGARVIARPFTLEIAAPRFEEFAVPVPISETAALFPGSIAAGPFDVGFLPISHSVPEAAALVIDCPMGRVIHTGDFKLDVTPVLGERFDADLWQQASAADILALACDSTNVFSPAAGRSESLVGPSLDGIFSEVEGMLAATTFASNLARVKQLADAAARSGRQVVFLGRAMERTVAAAERTGLLDRFPNVASRSNVHALPRREVMLLATGSQGEHRSATARLATGGMNGFVLGASDAMLFSSKTIPGNERDVARIINRLAERGVRVIDDTAEAYHVSGHANRPDLERIHDLVDPQMVIPMHGEHRHLAAHASLAEDRGYLSAIVRNGQVLDIGARDIVGEVEAGRSYLDGKVFVGSRDGILRERLRMARGGSIAVSVIEKAGRLRRDSVEIAVSGLPPWPDGDFNAALTDAVAAACGKSAASEAQIRRAVLTLSRRLLGKSPQISVLIHSS